MRDTLHWLPVRQGILYRVSTIAWRCILGVAPAYLSEFFVLSSSCPGRRSLRSASSGDYLIPRSSRRLVPLSGMTFLSNCALFHVIFRAHFIISLGPSSLPWPGLGALLSSYLKGRYINSIDRYRHYDLSQNCVRGVQWGPTCKLHMMRKCIMVKAEVGSQETKDNENRRKFKKC